MALFVKNRLRMNDESGQGNELESLKFVLNEYVTIDELKIVYLQWILLLLHIIKLIR